MRKNIYLSLINFKVKLYCQGIKKKKINTMMEVQILKKHNNFQPPASCSFTKNKAS